PTAPRRKLATPSGRAPETAPPNPCAGSTTSIPPRSSQRRCDPEWRHGFAGASRAAMGGLGGARSPPCRRWAPGPAVLGRAWTEKLATATIRRRGEAGEQTKLQRRRDLRERFQVQRVQRAGEVLRTQALGPVRGDVVVTEMHAADAREHGAHAVAGDHRA